jgi:hypothetical protein
MNTEQLNRIESLAMAATTGDWKPIFTGVGGRTFMAMVKENDELLFNNDNHKQNMEFAAAVNPKAVLELVTAVKQILDSHADLLEALKFAREKINEMDYDNGDGDCHYPLIEDAIEYAERNIASKQPPATAPDQTPTLCLEPAVIQHWQEFNNLSPEELETAANPLQRLFDTHTGLLEENPYAYCEVAYTKQTGWMAWLTDKSLAFTVVNPDRKILAQGQGNTPDEAALAALDYLQKSKPCIINAMDDTQGGE